MHMVPTSKPIAFCLLQQIEVSVRTQGGEQRLECGVVGEENSAVAGKQVGAAKRRQRLARHCQIGAAGDVCRQAAARHLVCLRSKR